MDLCKVNLFLLLCSVNLPNTDERCPKRTSLKNGQVRFQSRGGVTAIYTCNPGYLLRGSNVSHCQTDGHWSAPIPFCEPQGHQCASSKIETITLYPGQLINISCSKSEMHDKGNLFWIRNNNAAENTLNINNTLLLSTKKHGTYVCLLYNETTVALLKSVRIVSSLETLKLKTNTCQILFKDKTTFVNTSIGSRLALSCDVSSLTAQIAWFKNNEPIRDKNLTHLNFTNIMPDHEGNYSCFVQERDIPKCFIWKYMYVKVHNPSFPLPGNACGQPVVRRSKRVIDGSRAAPLSAPWMCMLALDREPPFCGCSLIAAKWIITAAHCFKNSNLSMMSQEDIQRKIRVKFGKQQRGQTEKGEIVRGIQRMIAYPKYTPNPKHQNITSEHDIALIKLDMPVVFQSNILPICLPPAGFVDSLPDGTLGIVTGWGRVSVRDSVMALTLQEAYLPLVNNSSCQSSTGYVITDNMLCAGYAESYRPDTCVGDSGGPFILQNQNSWYLAGIVSWGEGCSSPMKYGIYTKVEKYVPWIYSVWEQ